MLNMLIVDRKDHVEDFKSDSICSQKRLRHLILRPTTCSSISPPGSLIASSYCCSTLKTNNRLSWNHHPNNITDQPSKEEINTDPLVSSRWCPTTEQVKALQEMYQRGLRTPAAEEIQLITAKLSQFGKIEGKNVFYWFQNHKARERQKRRRQADSFSNKQGQDIETLETKETGLSWKSSEDVQNKKIVTTSSRRKFLKNSASMPMAATTETRSSEWSHFDERELQQTSKRTAKSANSLMDLSCISTSNYHHLNTITARSETLEAMKQQVSDALSFEISSPSSKGEDLIKLEHGSRENIIVLQLFPLQNDDESASAATKIDNKEVTASMSSNFTPNQFFEFL